MILRELAARYDLKFNDKGFKKADSAVAGTLSKLKQLGGALATAFAARAAFKFVDDIRETGDEIDKTSVALGVNRKALQEWRFAAGLGGVSTQELNVGLKTLQKAALDAADGAAEYKDEFDRLGITVTDSSGKLKSADILLTEMADGLQTLETDTEKVATASNLLGRSGSRLLPLFAKGSKGIREMRDEANALGGVLGDDVVDAAVELTDDIWRFDFAMLGIKTQIGRFILPLFNKLVKVSTAVTRKISELTKDTKFFDHALTLLGIVAAAVAVKMIIAFFPLIVVFLKWAVIIAAIVLVFDELMTLFEGGRTVVGRFIDELFGLGSAQEYVENHREGVKILKEAWDDALDAVANYSRDAADFAANIYDQYSWAFSGISGKVEELSKWLKTLGIDVGAIIEKAKELLKLIPGVGLVIQGFDLAKNLLPDIPEGAGEELKRRQTQRAKGRALGSGVARGPAMGETLAAGAQVSKRKPLTKGATGDVTRKRRRPARRRPAAPPQPPRTASPRVAVPGAQGGATVNQRTDVRVTVNAKTGAGARDIGAEVKRQVRDVIKKENRATMQAVKQHTGDA